MFGEGRGQKNPQTNPHGLQMTPNFRQQRNGFQFSSKPTYQREYYLGKSNFLKKPSHIIVNHQNNHRFFWGKKINCTIMDKLRFYSIRSQFLM